MQAVTIETSNHTIIQGYWFTPENVEANSIKGQVVIASAMGAAQDFYQPFAKWLTEHGYCVLTFDCSGMGKSKTKHVKEYQCDILEWAQQEYSAALKFVIDQNSSAPIFWLGPGPNAYTPHPREDWFLSNWPRRELRCSRGLRV
mgnify:CR=1 FL=1